MTAPGYYLAAEGDFAVDAVDLNEVVRIAPRVADIVARYWPHDGLVFVRAPHGPAVVLRGDEARQCWGLVDLLQRVIGPQKIQRPMRCYTYSRTRWREIDPGRRRGVTEVAASITVKDLLHRVTLDHARRAALVSGRRHKKAR